jgi:chloramphenicol 3-O-phosphotransferase
VSTQVIVLNGGSSSGKTAIARCLKATLDGPWLTLGIEITSAGEARVGPEFRTLASTDSRCGPRGRVYVVEVDTTNAEACECATRIDGRVR